MAFLSTNLGTPQAAVVVIWSPGFLHTSLEQDSGMGGVGHLSFKNLGWSFVCFVFFCLM